MKFIEENRSRLKKVVEEARKMAEECKTKKTYDFGANLAFDDEGKPCCVWGHTMARCGFAPSGKYTDNFATVRDFVMPGLGYFEQQDFEKCAQSILDPLRCVANENDEHQRYTDVQKLEQVSKMIELAASAIELLAQT